MENRFYPLIEVIRQKFDCDAQWLRSEHVRDERRGRTEWEGDVQIFAVKGCSTAETAYAWSWQAPSGHARVAAILNEGPIRSAGDAVRASILTQHEQDGHQASA